MPPKSPTKAKPRRKQAPSPKQAAHKFLLKEADSYYRQLVQSLPVAVYTTDAKGRVTQFNAAAAALWGRKPRLGKDLWCGSYRIFQPDGKLLPVDQCPMAVTLREGCAVRGVEIVIERPDGTRRNVLPYPDPIRDPSGRMVGAVNMLLDITDSKGAEVASRQLAAIVESSEDAILSKDLNSIINTWNRGAERLFGYTAKEIIGRPVTVLIPPERSDEEPSILERIRRGERIEHYETIRRHKNGSLVEISITVSPIKDATGRIVGASKIARDISQQKKAERELKQAHSEVVEASRAKDDFLAALSHELRTPLNPVLLLASEAADDPQFSTEVRQLFGTIRRNVELEARLIDDLLDITRIAHGKMSLTMAATDVHSVLREALAAVASEIEQKRITLIVDLTAPRCTVTGDAVRLQQVFWNVLKNAAKFTPEAGKVLVKTGVAGGELVITITDTGIGLTADERERIFAAFVQGDHSSTRGSHRFGGLGLGLVISRKLVEAHEGTIQAESRGRDKGSTFVIKLPLVKNVAKTAEPLPAPPAPPEQRTKAIHVLLVEDHEPTRTALAKLLVRRRYEVKTAASLVEARQISRQHKFNLLISDIGLPDGSGFELMQELRAQDKDLPGIALTGYGMEEDVARTQAAGFAWHLTKPVRMQFLEAALAEAVPN